MPFNINLDPNRFRRNLILLSAQSSAKKEIWPVLEQLGEGRFAALIDADEPFLEALDIGVLPPKWQEWMKMAPYFSGMIRDIDETALLALMPPWLQALVMRNDASKKWFLREALWIRQLFGASPPGPGRKREFVALSKGAGMKEVSTDDTTKQQHLTTGQSTPRAVEQPPGGPSPGG